MAFNTFKSSGPDNSVQLANGYKLTSSSGLTYVNDGFSGLLSLDESGSGQPTSIILLNEFGIPGVALDSTSDSKVHAFGLGSIGAGHISLGSDNQINFGTGAGFLYEVNIPIITGAIEEGSGFLSQAEPLVYTTTSGGTTTITTSGTTGFLVFSSPSENGIGPIGGHDIITNKITNNISGSLLRSFAQDGFVPATMLLTGSTNYNSVYVVRAKQISGPVTGVTYDNYGSIRFTSGSTDGYSSYVLIDESITGGTFNQLVNFHVYSPAADGPAAELFKNMPMYGGFTSPTGSTNTNGQLYFSPGSGVTFNTVYGFKVDDLKNSPGNTVTNSYAFYSEGDNDISYFAGKVGIGKVAPTKPLDVSGNTSIYGGYYGKCTSISTSGTTAVDGNTQVYWVDTSSGNVTLTLNPATLGSLFFEVKKLGTDGNSITISMTTGSIYADTGAQSSYTFSIAGAAIGVRSNGTDAVVV